MSDLIVTTACDTPDKTDLESRTDAENAVDTHVALCEDCGEGDVEIQVGDGGNTEVVEEPPNPDDLDMPDTENLETVEEKYSDELDDTQSTGRGLDKLGESLSDDPLDVLPSYMITKVEGDPSLNKRGVSVLAFHYDVEVVDFEVIVHPHETDYESSAMRFTVLRDGKEYVGHGEAHVDEVEKSKLLRMAETRAYKRAVIFATGTGIVGYQEIMSELEDGQ